MAIDEVVLRKSRKSRAAAAPPAAMSAEEWRTRVDLAAAYRLAVIYGWTDLNNTHFSARIPGTEHFLLNPFGMLFDEITASSLIKLDKDGTGSVFFEKDWGTHIHLGNDPLNPVHSITVEDDPIPRRSFDGWRSTQGYFDTVLPDWMKK